jgi:predicted nucleic acid-binding protein
MYPAGTPAPQATLISLGDPAISIITAQELIVGARDKRNLAGIDSLVSAYPLVHIDAPSGSLHTIF